MSATRTRSRAGCSGRCAACRRRCPGERVGNVGRNTRRADGIGNVDFGFTKTTRFANGQNIQYRLEMFNANTRNFRIPDGRVTSANFLTQWATDGGNRRIWMAVRWVF